MMRRAAFALVALLAFACTDQPTELKESAPGLPNFAATPGPGSFGTTLDIEAVLDLPQDLTYADSALEAQFRAQISPHLFPFDEPTVEMLMKKWLQHIATHKLVGNLHDLKLYQALSDYWNWHFFATALFSDVGTRFGSTITLFQTFVRKYFPSAIDGNIATCRDALSVEALANAIFWFDQGNSFQVLNSPPAQYDAQTLQTEIRNKCAEVMLTQVTLPPVLDVGTSYTMRIDYTLGLGLSLIPRDAVFDVTVNASNATVQQGAFTDPTGVIDLTVQANAVGTVDISVGACLVLPNRTVATPHVCLEELITRQAQDPTPPPPPPAPPPPPPSNCSGTLTASIVQVFNIATLNAVKDFQVIDGNLAVAANDSLVNVSFPCLRTVTGTMGITNNRAMLQIAFPALVEVGKAINLGSNPILTAADFQALRQVGKVGAVASTVPGALAVNNNPALINLSIGQVTIHRNVPSQLGGLQIMQPLGLTNLSGVSTAISVDTLFFTLPAPGQPGLDSTDFRAYKNAAPLVQAVCNLPFGPGGARVCL